MANISWVNRSIFLATNTGTASFGIGAAVTGYMTPSSASAIDGEQYHYAAETTNGSGTVSAWEVGTGVYTATASTLARTPIFSSATSNGTVSFATAPYVMLTALAEDFRVKLNADINYYVATTGSDTANNGLTVGSPFRTIQHAADVIRETLDLSKYTATVNIAAGTYDEFVSVGQPPLSSSIAPQGYGITFQGATAGGSTIIKPTTSPSGFNQFALFQVTGPGQFKLDGVTLDGTSATGAAECIYVSEQCHLYIGNITINGTSINGGSGFGVDEAGYISINGVVAVNGPLDVLIYLISGSFGLFNSGAINFLSNPNFRAGHAIEIGDSSKLVHNNLSYSGSVTGAQYSITQGSLLITNGITLPGSTTGNVIDDTSRVDNLLKGPQVISEAVGSSALTINGAIQTTSNPFLNVTQTWNGPGVFFTGLKCNITNTASRATSLIADIEIGGITALGVRSDGTLVLLWPGAGGVPQIIPNADGFGSVGLGSDGDAVIAGFVYGAGGLSIENGREIAFGSSGLSSHDTFISRSGAATLQQGEADAVAPVAQTFRAQSVVAGTTNTAGADWTMQGSLGTGNAIGGKIIFKTAAAGTSGTSQNTSTAVFTIPPPGVAGNISVGFNVTPGNGGTLATGGTFTATAANGNYQYYTNNGAHTFANPSADCAIDVMVTNGAAAGTITFSTFTTGTTGDALTTTSGNKFIISVRRINSVSTYLIKALQ